jgi:hypothetical protein
MPPALRKQAMAALARPVERAISDDELAAAVALIRPRLMRETQALSRILGRDFPEWRWLHDGAPPSKLD